MKRKSNFIVTILVVLVLAIGALALYEAVPKVLKMSNEKLENAGYTFDDEYFIEYLRDFSYVNGVKLLTGTDERAADVFLDLTYIAEEDKEFVKRQFEERINSMGEFAYGYRNLQYYLYDPSTKQNYYNNSELSSMLTTKGPENELQDYQFLTIMEYDESGNVSIKYLRGGDTLYFENTLNTLGMIDSRELTYNLGMYDDSPYEEYLNEQGIPVKENQNVSFTEEKYPNYQEQDLIKPIKNITFIYGIPKELKYSDGISDLIWNQKMESAHSAKDMILWIWLGGMLVATLFAILVPYRFSKEGVFARVILRFYTELLLGLYCVVVIGSIVLVDYITNKIIYPEDRLTDLPSNINALLEHGLNLVGFFLTLCVAYLFVVTLKYVFHQGFFSYLKEKSIVVRYGGIVGRKLKKWYQVITTLEFSEKGIKKLFLLLGIHTVITIGLCAIWFFGIPFAILYNVFLGIVLIKKYKLIKGQYDSLLDSAKNITAGDLDTLIQEDMGVFNPVRDELNRLRDGLKHAVEEEVKSQNMRTELITNVSHDLKTPLTSIITYVDLLKNTTLTEEERMEYVGILEGKSQRLKGLIEDLFEMSKTTSKNLVLSYQNLDLITLLKEVLVEFEDKLEQASLQVKTDYQENQIVCYLDSEKTYRVFENLFGNVIKYAMSNTRVYITALKTEKEAVITIKNISHSEINYQGEQLFERFVRGDLSRNTEGSGLGLAIAKGLTEAQGGMIGIEVDGDLFKVTIRFPLSIDTDEGEVGLREK